MSDVRATPTQTASLSDVGSKRQTNQDHCGEFTGAAGELLLVLCDGMGGHQGGEVASQLGVAAIGEFVAAGGASAEELLRGGFARAHEMLRVRALEEPSLRGMGTTAVALLSDGSEAAWVAHTGDSRAYRVRDGHVKQLTADHSVVAEQLRRGLLTRAEAKRLPHNELLHALGASADLRVDVSNHDLRSGDRFVLCSDGLWNLVEDREMATLALQLEPEAAVRRLVDLANERGANDNVTVQILAVGPPSSLEVLDDDDETERDLVLELSGGAASPMKDGTVVGSTASVEAIWERARAVERARRGRRLRRVAMASVLIAIALIGTILWLRQAMVSTHDVAAPIERSP